MSKGRVIFGEASLDFIELYISANQLFSSHFVGTQDSHMDLT